MKLLAILVISTALLAGCNISFNSGSESAGKVTAGSAAQEKAVAKAATKFLRQLDTDNASATWANASPYLHQRSTKATWVATIHTLRGTVGAIKHRKIKGFGFTHTVKGVPKGNYAAVAFDAAFANATVQEKVVLQNDDGTWKAMGYFITKKFTAKL